MRSLLTLAFVGVSTADAQDRSLIETLRIGITRGELIAGHLQSSEAFGNALRRKGILVEWHDFADGLETIDALSSGAVDIALDVNLHQMAAARSMHLTMVLIVEFRSEALAVFYGEAYIGDAAQALTSLLDHSGINIRRQHSAVRANQCQRSGCSKACSCGNVQNLHAFSDARSIEQEGQKVL
jgi:ABC-type phosphate/phosphonate transport system substrate-binding protein